MTEYTPDDLITPQMTEMSNLYIEQIYSDIAVANIKAQRLSNLAIRQIRYVLPTSTGTVLGVIDGGLA